MALIGLGLALAGLAFPPLEIAASVFMTGSEILLAAAVAVDVVVAIEHPTQDNWVTVGGDVVAIGTGYVVGKVVAGPIVRGVRSLLGREVGAEAGAVLPQTQQAVDQALHRAGAAADDELADELAARQAAAETVTRNARIERLSRDPQNGEINPKSIEEAHAIIQAEEAGIINNPKRPNTAMGEPNLDFKVEGPSPYKYCDVKTPIEPGSFPRTSIDQQATGIAGKIKKQKAGSSNVLHLIDLKNVSAANKEAFKAKILSSLESTEGVTFIND